MSQRQEMLLYLSSVWLSTLTKMEEVEMVPMEEPSKKDGLAGTRSGRRNDPNTAEGGTTWTRKSYIHISIETVH